MRKIFLPLVIILLGYGLWYSSNFSQIAAGVAILLFGVLFMEDGFKSFTKGPFKRILKKSTSNLPKSILVGTVSTTLLQSSSLITVITISFLSAGLISLSGGIGIILGANIGTTTGAWLIATFGLKVKISAFALPMLVFGILLVFQKNKKIKGIGNILAGLGFLFLGIHYMKEGFETFKDHIDLAEYAMGGFGGLLVFTGIGIVATVIMQSSHATLAIILTALAAGQITYENSIALAIGANIGTTITAILGSLGADINGKRLAGAHLIFNVFTGLIALVFVHQFIWLVEEGSEVLGIRAGDYTLKLSLFHTLFNLVGVMIMIPLTGKLAKSLTKFLKEPPAKDIAQVKYLNPAAARYPQSAITALLKESRHLFDNSFEIIAHGLNLHREDILSNKPLTEVVEHSKDEIVIDIDEVYNKRIKSIYNKIIEFATTLESEQLSEYYVQVISQIKIACRDTVAVVKDIKDLQRNMTKYMSDDNEFMRTEYNSLRLAIAEFIRKIYNTQSEELNADELKANLKKLVKFRKQLKKHNQERILIQDKMIRNGKITPAMATSLMNDSQYTTDICKNLIKASELLYFNKDTLTDFIENGNDFKEE